MLMVEATMDMETSFLEDMMVMEISLLKDIKELGTKHGLEKSESKKENECFIEKQESIEKEQKEKEFVAHDKSEEDFGNKEENCFEKFKANSWSFVKANLRIGKLLLKHIFPIIYILWSGVENEKLQGPITRARADRIKKNDDQVAHGLMIAIEETMKEGLKFKNGGLEDDGNHPKLLMIQCINLEQPMEKIRRGTNQEEFHYVYGCSTNNSSQ
ncbi:hypothetical protein M9H77_23319 [Catharanthus roseus]|uniref:Uncharacterized protein n=1 Tax=Catharanthus roseus TaxID=4058 RepID=A0ACC0ATP4_CATRO|nr:hypothetical protein M9H77_23319 [Catharanthus roseus]